LIAHARQTLEDWRADYNAERPHSRLGWLPPNEHARRLRGGLEPGGREPSDVL
jgi:putative transposase